jgi:prefoldin subunit 5
MIFKIPEIEKALDIIHTLQKQKGLNLFKLEISIDYLLTESVWAKAKANDTSKIAIWLGANTMVELTLE